MRNLLKLSHLSCFCLALSLLAGCTNMQEHSLHVNREGGDLAAIPLSYQGLQLKNPMYAEHSCLFPPQDAVKTMSESGGFSLGVVGKSEEAKEGVSEGALSLGGRSPAVLLARELLFRACELTGNYNFTKEEARDLYDKVFAQVGAISQYQLNAGASGGVLNPQIMDPQLSLPVAEHEGEADQNTSQDAEKECEDQGGTVDSTGKYCLFDDSYCDLSELLSGDCEESDHDGKPPK